VSRLSLADLRRLILAELDGDWITPTEVGAALGLGKGLDWYRVSLLLERLAHDGEAEIRISGRRRYFRRAA
jgi:hypothetical protein